MRTSPLRHPARLAGASLLRLQSDERLAELAIDGHEAAFDAIVVRYRPAIQRYCAGIVGAGRAEDATQQTLINAHDALDRTDEVRHLRSWLYRIAHNASLNVLRSVRDDVPLDELTARGALGRADDGPVESFERSERFRATLAAVQELPERQRAALILRELEGRSHEEIAEALGVTKGSARQHLMRARVAVRSAVTAITPYPLIVRLADGLSGTRGGGWAEAVAGAGAGATLTKMTAGVVATGALVGGAVGTDHAIFRGESQAPRAAEVRGGTQPVAKAAAAGPSSAATPSALVRARDGSSAASRSGEPRSNDAGSGTKGRRGAGGATAPAGGQQHDSAPGSASQDAGSGTSRRGGAGQGKGHGSAKSKGRAGVKGKSHGNGRHQGGSKGSGRETTSGAGNGAGKSVAGSSGKDGRSTSGSGEDAKATTPAPVAGTAPEDGSSAGPAPAAGTPLEPAASGTTTTPTTQTSKNRATADGDEQ